MNALRALLLVAGVTLNVAWLISMCVRGSLGAPDLNPQLAIGPLPPSPAPLAPLIIPQRDPFAADMLAKIPGSVVPFAFSPPLKAGVAALNVPDVSAFATQAGSFGVVATIVGREEAYALVEDGATVRVVHVGDAFGGSAVAEIAVDYVRLSSGNTIAMTPRATSISPAPFVATPSASPFPFPSVALEKVSTASPAVPGATRQGQALPGAAVPAGTVLLPQPFIGQPAGVAPKGAPAIGLGAALFRSMVPSPSLVMPGGAIAGGNP